MVEPIDAQNMLSRTPLVEKTAAAQKDQAALLNQPTTQLEKEKQHMQDKVSGQHDPQKVTDDKKKKTDDERHDTHAQQEPEHSPEIELVQDPAEEPTHKLDVTI